MERKVGEVFTHNGKTYIVEKRKFADSCENCCFFEEKRCTLKNGMNYFGKCGKYLRTDHIGIIFKEIKENMETKELKIEIPQGYEIDKEKSTFENIVFKKIDSRPKSWKEYLDKVNPSYSINEYGNVGYWVNVKNFGDDRLFFDNKNLAEKVIAYGKLLALREEWIKGEEFKELKFNIFRSDFGATIFSTKSPEDRLTFPTEEMADEFIKCFQDLLEEAEGLY